MHSGALNTRLLSRVDPGGSPGSTAVFVKIQRFFGYARVLLCLP